MGLAPVLVMLDLPVAVSGDSAGIAAEFVVVAGNFDDTGVEAAGNSDIVVVVEAVGTDGVAAVVAVENVDIGVFGNLYYHVDAAVVECLYRTTKCNVFHPGVLCRALCTDYTHLGAGNGNSLDRVPNPIA